MRRKIRILCLLFGIVNFVISCSKEVEPKEDLIDITVPTSGFLCTYSPFSSEFTEAFVAVQSNDNLVAYWAEHANPKLKLKLAPTGGSTVRIELIDKTAYRNPYIGIKKNPNMLISPWPNHQYLFALYANPVPETIFKIERKSDEVTKFTIESDLYKGFYLNPTRTKQAHTFANDSWVFDTKKTYFYFK